MNGTVNEDPDWDPQIDMTVAHEARVYDYLLGGKTNFAVDREAAVRAGEAVGGIEVARASVRGNRDFLGRAVRYLAGEAGVRQFLDIGTGIPNEDNVHSIAQVVAPQARIVYVDNDPIVLAHAHQLLQSTPEGSTAYIHGDLRAPDEILSLAAETLDFAEPIAVMLVAILHHIPDDEDPYGIVAQIIQGVPSGSHLVVSHLASDLHPDEMAALTRSVPARTRYTFTMRSHAEVSRFFDGLVLVAPGVVPINQWRPGDPPAGTLGESVPEGQEGRESAHHHGAVGHKP